MKFYFYVSILFVFVTSCSKDFTKVAPESVVLLDGQSYIGKIGSWSCSINISIDSLSTSSKPFNTWIEAIAQDFNSKDTYLRFNTNYSQNTSQQVRIQFLPKEKFITSNGKGVFAYPNYGICLTDSLTIYLNRDFDWTENLVKKTVAYQLGRMLDLSYFASDKSSIMNPELSQPYSGMSPIDSHNFQAKFNRNALSATITKGPASGRSISFLWAINNPQERLIKGTGLCWSSTNSNPTVNDEKNYFANSRSGYWATGWNKPGATVYFRSYIITDCEIIYSPVLRLNVPKVNTWEVGSTAPFSRRTEASIVATEGFYGKAFIIGGKLASNNKLTNEVWMHQPGLNLWKQVKSFPGVVRESATCFYYLDKIYYGLGYASENYTYPIDWWEYNTTTDTWTQKGNAYPIGLPGAIGFSTPSGGIFTLGQNSQSGTFSQITRKYNASNNTWSAVPSFPIASGFKGYASIGENLYILLPNNRFIVFNGNYWYEAQSFPYTDSPSNNLRSQYNTMIASQNNIYYGYKETRNWLQYAPATNSWNLKTTSPTYFTSNSMFYTVGDKVYVIDGNNQQIWEYNVE